MIKDTMKDEKPIGLGLIGIGGFGRFCLSALESAKNVGAVYVSAAHVTSKVNPADSSLPVPVLGSPEELLARSDVGLVHIATPPSAHHGLVLMALRAGKHVLCEKPLAISLEQADEMLNAADKAHRLLAVNYVMRYNPITEAVKAIIDSGVLGRVLSGALTNCASDSGLTENHWFWDKSISGGIFIEHGVHFFDLYRYWCGPGEVISAHTETRDQTTKEDRVSCTVRHDSGAIVYHYHGFDQIPLMDRTTHRLVCEMGDIRISGWIPVSLQIDAAVDDRGVEKLRDCCRGAEIEILETYTPSQVRTTGRGRARCVTQRIALRYARRLDKQPAYAKDFGDLIADQVAYIRNPAHPRRITEANGREALVLASSAVSLAELSER